MIVLWLVAPSSCRVPVKLQAWVVRILFGNSLRILFLRKAICCKEHALCKVLNTKPGPVSPGVGVLTQWHQPRQITGPVRYLTNYSTEVSNPKVSRLCPSPTQIRIIASLQIKLRVASVNKQKKETTLVTNGSASMYARTRLLMTQHLGVRGRSVRTVRPESGRKCRELRQLGRKCDIGQYGLDAWYISAILVSMDWTHDIFCGKRLAGCI